MSKLSESLEKKLEIPGDAQKNMSIADSALTAVVNPESRIETISHARPVVLSLSASGLADPFASKSIASSLFDYDDTTFKFTAIDDLEQFISLMNNWKKSNLLQNVKYILINSAPSYFRVPSSKLFELMIKYKIYNRGLPGDGNNYYDTPHDIQGIVRLIRGEYPELPRPIVLCDGSDVLDTYNDDYIVLPIAGLAFTQLQPKIDSIKKRL